MKTILYLGNKLAVRGKNPTTIDTLSNYLRDDFHVIAKSDFLNQVARFFDMMWAIIRHRRTLTVVLIDTYSNKAFYYAFIAARICEVFRIQYIPVLHGGELGNRYRKTPELVDRYLHQAKCIVAPSLFLKRLFESKGFEVISIPNVIRVSDYPFLKRAIFQPKLLYVRAFQEIYNPMMAIEVMHLLKPQFPTASLCMVGPDKDGSMQLCKDRVKSLGLEDCIRFTGKLSQPEWHQLATEYDFLINTTHADNMPVSLIEGMALGLLIVSTNVGGIPDLIEDGKEGMLVNANDPDQMMSAIVKGIHQPDKSFEMTLRARQRAEQYDWKAVRPKWKNVILKPISKDSV